MELNASAPDIIRAANAGDIEALRAAVQSGQDINTTAVIDGLSWTPVLVAAFSNHVEALRYAISCGGDASKTVESGANILFFGAHLGSVPIIQVALECGVSVESSLAHTHWTPLHWAASRGHVTAVAYLISMGADAKSRVADGFNLLLTAAEGGSVEIMQMALAHGCSINDKTSDGIGVLNLAARRGHVEAMHFALSRGACPDGNEYGWTPLLLAAQGGHCDVMRFALQSGANIHERSANGFSALLLCAENGSTNGIRVCTEFDADYKDAVSFFGVVALAMHNDHLDAASLLLSLGALYAPFGIRVVSSGSEHNDETFRGYFSTQGGL